MLCWKQYWIYESANIFTFDMYYICARIRIPNRRMNIVRVQTFWISFCFQRMASLNCLQHMHSKLRKSSACRFLLSFFFKRTHFMNITTNDKVVVASFSPFKALFTSSFFSSFCCFLSIDKVVRFSCVFVHFFSFCQFLLSSTHPSFAFLFYISLQFFFCLNLFALRFYSLCRMCYFNNLFTIDGRICTNQMVLYAKWQNEMKKYKKNGNILTICLKWFGWNENTYKIYLRTKILCSILEMHSKIRKEFFFTWCRKTK